MHFIGSPRSFALVLALLLSACDSTPATPDAPVTDAGSDAPVATDSGRPDAGAACIGGTVCTLAPNAGCGGATSCAYAFAGGMRTNECIAPGTQTIGESCATNGECSSGLSCLAGYCVAPCCPGASPDSCATGTTCSAFDINVGGATPDNIGICGCTVGGAPCATGFYCDPIVSGTEGFCLAQGSCSRLLQDCPVGEGCYGTVRECATAGTAALDAPCMAHRDCVPGHWCRSTSATTSVCTAYCDTAGPVTCPAGFMCMSFGDDEPTVGGCYPM